MPKRPGPKKGSRNWRWEPIIRGTQYGDWTVVSEMPRVGPSRYAYCECKCGAFKAVALSSLKAGTSTKCPSCANKGENNTQFVHGLAKRGKQTVPYQLWAGTRHGARQRGLEHTITPYDIEVPDVCPVLGIKLRPGGSNVGFKDDLASVDRIDSSLGYVPGNIRVISWRANRLKSDNTIDTLEKILVYMRAEIGNS